MRYNQQELTALAECFLADSQWNSEAGFAILFKKSTADGSLAKTLPDGHSAAAATSTDLSYNAYAALFITILTEIKQAFYSHHTLSKENTATSEPIIQASFDTSPIPTALVLALHSIRRLRSGLTQDEESALNQVLSQPIPAITHRLRTISEQAIYMALLNIDLSDSLLCPVDSETDEASTASGGAVAATSATTGDNFFTTIINSDTYKEILLINKAIQILSLFNIELSNHLKDRPAFNLGRLPILGGSAKEKKQNELHELIEKCHQSKALLLNSRTEPQDRPIDTNASTLLDNAQKICEQILCKLRKKIKAPAIEALSNALLAHQSTQPMAAARTKASTPSRDRASTAPLFRKDTGRGSGGGAAAHQEQPQLLQLKDLYPYQLRTLGAELLQISDYTIEQTASIIQYLLTNTSAENLIEMMRVPTAEGPQSDNYDAYRVLLCALVSHMKKSFHDHAVLTEKTGDDGETTTQPYRIDCSNVPLHWQKLMDALVSVNKSEQSDADSSPNPQGDFNDGFSCVCVKFILDAMPAATDLEAEKRATKHRKDMFTTLLTTTQVQFERQLTQGQTGGGGAAAIVEQEARPANPTGDSSRNQADKIIQNCLSQPYMQLLMTLEKQLDDLEYFQKNLQLHLESRKIRSLHCILGSSKEHNAANFPKLIADVKAHMQILITTKSVTAEGNKAHQARSQIIQSVCNEAGTGLQASNRFTGDKHLVKQRTPPKPSVGKDNTLPEDDPGTPRRLNFGS
jgi:hypothetical protein